MARLRRDRRVTVSMWTPTNVVAVGSWSANINGFTQPMVETVDVIPILSAEQLDDCWVEGLKVLAPDDSVWRASAYCGGPGFWSSHKHGVWWQDLWERYGDTLRILGPSLRYRTAEQRSA